MDIEVPSPTEESEEEKPEEEKEIKPPKKPRTRKKTEKPKEEVKENLPETTQEPAKLEIKTIQIEETMEIKTEEKETNSEVPVPAKAQGKERLFSQEGQLAIDVFQTENYLIIQSAIAGIKANDLDINIEKDIISIRGKRERQFDEKGDYFIQECFWGPFSREIILPVEVDPNFAEAGMKEGVLTIKLPKIQKEKRRKIVIK